MYYHPSESVHRKKRVIKKWNNKNNKQLWLYEKRTSLYYRDPTPRQKKMIVVDAKLGKGMHHKK